MVGNQLHPESLDGVAGNLPLKRRRLRLCRNDNNGGNQQQLKNEDSHALLTT
jgi:hypothetical protein